MPKGQQIGLVDLPLFFFFEAEPIKIDSQRFELGEENKWAKKAWKDPNS